MPGFRAMIEGFGDPQDSVLIGFSQGAIMVLQAVADERGLRPFGTPRRTSPRAISLPR